MEIPNLTHEDLVAFHRKHYHPSNARFYTYGVSSLSRRCLACVCARVCVVFWALTLTPGSLDLAPVLADIDAVISQFEPLPRAELASLDVPDDMRWDHERERCITGPPNPTSDPERQTQVSTMAGPGEREVMGVYSQWVSWL